LNTSKIDVLPSFNVIYDITSIDSTQKKKKNQGTNLRFSYGQTINRPEYRELAPFAFYDFTTNFVVSGNDTLVRAKIQNLDLRYEKFFGRGQLFTVSGFFKYFDQPIEQKLRADVSGEITYQNATNATNIGLEAEFKSKFSSIFKVIKDSTFASYLSFASNIAFIHSSVDVSTIVGSETNSRPLQGQSPFLVNVSFRYDNPISNWGAAINLNRTGRRIFIVGNVNDPTLWENGRTFIDFQLSKRINNAFELKLNIGNVLAQNQLFYQNSSLSKKGNGLSNSFVNGDKNYNTQYQKGTDDLVWKTNFGRTISCSLSYRF
jgi:hypothetical protein